MSMCRRFHGQPVSRLIVSVPVATVQAIDNLLDPLGPGHRHPANGCRSEFVRQAIAEKLARDRRPEAPETGPDAKYPRHARARGLKL